MTINKLWFVALLLALMAGFYALGLHHIFTLEAIKAQQTEWQMHIKTYPIISISIFILIYMAMTALSLPTAVPMTLLAGALFGVLWGTVIVSFASTAGATLAMLAARYVLRDTIQARYTKQLQRFNEGFAKEGPFYLFALRLVPVAPFFLINMVMGLLPIKTFTYFWVSQLGMLPGTAVYVYAGTALASISSLKDIATPQLLVAFALLGLLPLIAKKVLSYFRKGAVA